MISQNTAQDDMKFHLMAAGRPRITSHPSKEDLPDEDFIDERSLDESYEEEKQEETTEAGTGTGILSPSCFSSGSQGVSSSVSQGGSGNL